MKRQVVYFFAICVMILIPIVVFLLFNLCDADVDESSGFLPIRPDGQMFYWLMRTKNATHDYKSFPLVMYTAGGPGDGSSGYSNFAEVGPQDVHLKERKDSWLKHANLLFFDHPIGCGYSFVTDGGQFCRNQSMLDADFMQALKLFLQKHPEFKTIPSYIFGESYGGKYAVGAAIQIHKQKIDINLRAIALADPWISPMETTKTWPDYLHHLTFINWRQRQELTEFIGQIEYMWNTGEKEAATFKWQSAWTLIWNMTFGVDLHNVFTPRRKWTDLIELMNSKQMRQRLSIPDNVTWGSQELLVFNHLAVDFLTPVVDQVSFILQETDIRVAVYSGQFDSIVTMTGTEEWIRRLDWRGLESFLSSEKKLLFHQEDSAPLAYVTEYGKLSLFHMLRAGHSVPMDQLKASVAMLRKVIGS